jgi:hypothetical protein
LRLYHSRTGTNHATSLNEMIHLWSNLPAHVRKSGIT